MAASQILKNTNALLEQAFSAGDATGNVVVTVTRGDGTQLSTGNATHTGIVGSGTYTYTVAPQTELDYLTVVWAGTFGGVAQSITSYAEIVGGLLFALSDLRAFGDRTLADVTTYPDEDLREARERITDLFETVCGVSFIPRYARDTLDGYDSWNLDLYHNRPRRIIAASINGTVLSAPEIAAISLYPSGRICRQPTQTSWWGPTRQNVVVAYEHGWTSVPSDIARAALVLARYELVSNDLSDRMVGFDNDLGSVRLSVPGRNYPTGIPVVDATLARYDECAAVLA
jgi:hypothetical protein